MENNSGRTTGAVVLQLINSLESTLQNCGKWRTIVCRFGSLDNLANPRKE